MRALVIDKAKTQFMQCMDLFNKSKVVFNEYKLKYSFDGVTEVIDEDIIKALAFAEFKDELICLFGEHKPVYINPEIQTISNGHQFTTLLEVLKNSYPNLNFQSNDKLMNIIIA